MARVFIGIGSNLGDRENFLEQAIFELTRLDSTIVKQYSSIYETEPVGIKEQPKFLNMVAELDTALSPAVLLQRLKQIETAIGRTQSQHWGPREIDLDMLYYDNEIFHDDKLHLPHPEIPNRRFILVPMKEIAAEFQDPLRHLKIGELLQLCSDTSAVRKTLHTISPNGKDL
jgi:2-amino-4-hydroxy-6-hydroxymethyldihydropteridine diphosphokinase